MHQSHKDEERIMGKTQPKGRWWQTKWFWGGIVPVLPLLGLMTGPALGLGQGAALGVLIVSALPLTGLIVAGVLLPGMDLVDASRALMRRGR